MRSIPFSKFHGLGNDYIVFEMPHLEDVRIPDLARAVCERHTGAGADGIAVLNKLPDGDDADYFCEIINPDGSIAGFSGNGTRCAVAYLYHTSNWTAPTLRLGTQSGVKDFRLLDAQTRGHYVFESEIGAPQFASGAIPFAGPLRDAVIDQKLDISRGSFLVSCVNVGNPVACVFVDDFAFDWRSVGRELEVHEAFPQKANIVFVKPVDRRNAELRIWERGAGETSASGTCASGAAVLSAFTGRCEREIEVHTVGGMSRVVWRADDEIVLTGTADFVYRAEWPLAI